MKIPTNACLKAALVAAVIVFSGSTEAAYHVYHDPDGTPVLVNEGSPAPAAAPSAADRRKFARIVAEVAAEVMLDPGLISAVITRESGWRPRAISSKGAIGLMQLMPRTAKNWGVQDPFDPRQNIEGGARHLKHLLDLFDRNLPLALGAYHAGEDRTIKEGVVPTIKETQSYVRSVLDTYSDLSKRSGRR